MQNNNKMKHRASCRPILRFKNLIGRNGNYSFYMELFLGIASILIALSAKTGLLIHPISLDITSYLFYASNYD
jgi:hypothetical protein